MTPAILTTTSLSDLAVCARFRGSLAAEGVVTRAAIARAIIRSVPTETAQGLLAQRGMLDASDVLRDLRATPIKPLDEETELTLDNDDRKAVLVFNALRQKKITLEQAFQRIVRGTKDVGELLRTSHQQADLVRHADAPQAASQIQAIVFGHWATKHTLAAKYYSPGPDRAVSDWARDKGRINPDFLTAIKELESETFGTLWLLREHETYAASPYGRIKSTLGPEASLVAEVLTAHAFGQIGRQPFDLFTLAWTLEPLGPSRILAPLRRTVREMCTSDWLYISPDDGEVGLHHRFAASDALLSDIIDWLRQYEPLSAAEFRQL